MPAILQPSAVLTMPDRLPKGWVNTTLDERQRAEAIELAASESQAHGFQYICALNSDYVPRNEFSPGFLIEDYIRLRSTDAEVAGCLLGLYFIESQDGSSAVFVCMIRTF